MNGIENINKAILGQAQAEADEILAQAQVETDGIRAEGTARAREMADRIIQNAENQAKDLMSRSQMSADLKSRRTTSATKQKLINQAFEEAASRIVGLPEKEYGELLSSLLKRANEDKLGGEVVLNERDKQLYAQKLQSEFGGEGITIAQQSAKITGGLILRRKSVEINCAIDVLIRMLKDEAAFAVSGALFS